MKAAASPETRTKTFWVRVHRKGRQPGRWLEEKYASREKLDAAIADHKSLHSDVLDVEVREHEPAEIVSR